MRKAIVGIGFLMVTAFGGSAHANIVANPGFELDYCSPGGTNGLGDACLYSSSQSYSNPTDWTVSGTAGSDDANPNSGNMDGFLEAGTLSQDLSPTESGQTYAISFYVAEDTNLWNADNSADTLEIDFGTTVLDTITGDSLIFASPNAYALESYNATAADVSTLLSFTATDPSDDGDFFIDDVSVVCTTCSTTPPAAPEPNALGYFSVAVIGIALYRRARRRSGSLV